MRTWLRRIRGAIGMGVTWAAAWSAAGVVPPTVRASLQGEALTFSNTVRDLTILMVLAVAASHREYMGASMPGARAHPG